jgi:hypothetical protein
MTLSIDTQHNSVECHYAERRYAECRHYAERRYAESHDFFVMLNVIMPNVIMLSVVRLNVILLSVLSFR